MSNFMNTNTDKAGVAGLANVTLHHAGQTH